MADKLRLERIVWDSSKHAFFDDNGIKVGSLHPWGDPFSTTWGEKDYWGKGPSFQGGLVREAVITHLLMEKADKKEHYFYTCGILTDRQRGIVIVTTQVYR